ncbi:hypothetical protein PENARI_c069G03296 [Penicillium arizonense]|uniref:Uncharacterized protein n=1 Tax=Penicillium arizonense TaxID=1835702 RepID=A0A1F5L270_PENAI|nr:hypothetical protein PENARI_c069G03296 [Penicillium arizonense]OGE47059.1 hypothetical protein PENARI_c069G03296 [Penicillium arizonense]
MSKSPVSPSSEPPSRLDTRSPIFLLKCLRKSHSSGKSTST